MNASFPLPGWKALVLAVALAAPCGSALASDNQVLVPRIDPAELQNLQSRQQRLDFQQRQQINRELDSLSIRRQQPRIDVPVMKPRCTSRQSGSNYISQGC